MRYFAAFAPGLLALLVALPAAAQSPSGGGVDLCDDTTPQLCADLDPNGFGIGTSTAALGDGSSATFTLDIDLSGADFALNFDATDGCLGMGGEDVLCWLNDGTDSTLTLTGDSTQTLDHFRIRKSDDEPLFAVSPTTITINQAGNASGPGITKLLFYNDLSATQHDRLEIDYTNSSLGPKIRQERSSIPLTIGSDGSLVFESQGISGIEIGEGSTSVEANVDGTLRDIQTSAHGSLYEKDLDGTPANSISITTGGTYVGWTTATAGITAGGVTLQVADATADGITPADAGDYEIEFSVSAGGSSNITALCCAFVDDAAPAGGPCAARKLSTGGDVGSFGTSALLTLSASQQIDLRCTTLSGEDTKTLDLWAVHLNVSRAGS